MNILTLDFETYFDKKYSLSTMTNVEYVLDPRFHVHGLAIRHVDGKCEFRADDDAALAELKALHGERLERVTVLMHNACFDALVLKFKFGLAPAHIIDSMLMSYHVHGRKGEGGEGASLGAVAARCGAGQKEVLQFMLGVRHPDAVQFAQLSKYAKNDVEVTFGIMSKLLPQITRPAVELPMMQHTIKGFIERSLKIDTDGIKQQKAEIENDARAWLKKAAEVHGDIKNFPETLDQLDDVIGKNKVFTNLLEQAMARTNRLVPLKRGKNAWIPAVAKKDPQMLGLLEDSDPLVQALAKARLGKKSAEQVIARLDRLATVTSLCNGELPVFLQYYGAHTGRFSGGQKFNLQNLGRDKRGGQMRSLLTAHPEHTFVIADLAQIEARILAWLAGQHDLLEAFTNKRDVYSEFASKEIFHTTIKKTNKSDPDHAYHDPRRQVGKQAVLGLGYSMGALKFMNTRRADPSTAMLFEENVLSPALCAQIVKSFRQRFDCIKSYWDEVNEAFLTAMYGGTQSVGKVKFEKKDDTVLIWLPSGRALRYAKARTDSTPHSIRYLNEDGEEEEFTPYNASIVYGNMFTKLYGGKITENIVQAVARDILVEAILELENRGRLVLFHVHDEVIVEAKVAEVEAVKAEVKQVLETAPKWAAGLPISAEVDSSARYNK